MIEPRWLDKRDVLMLHELSIARFGGASGLRDDGLLESALMRPANLFMYEAPDLCACAAAYIVGLVKNHPFVDGNKRTGFLAGTVFLEDNGLVLTADEAAATQAIVAVAAGDLSDQDLAQWLRDHTDKG